MPFKAGGGAAAPLALPLYPPLPPTQASQSSTALRSVPSPSTSTNGVSHSVTINPLNSSVDGNPSRAPTTPTSISLPSTSGTSATTVCDHCFYC